jgi:hypothetical protein
VQVHIHPPPLSLRLRLRVTSFALRHESILCGNQCNIGRRTACRNQ